MRRLTTEVVLDRLGLKSRETLRTRIKAGLFPKPMRDPGSTINFWLESDVDDYLTAQATARDSAAERAAA